MKRSDTIAKIEHIANSVAAPHGIEIVEVELKGSGRQQLLRIVIDRPEGISHDDCALITREVGDILDVEDPIAASYELEVSSPGVERKLLKWHDWERFTGQKAKVFLREPVDNLKFFEGVISAAREQTVTVELAGGKHVAFPFEKVDRANLKFEWK